MRSAAAVVAAVAFVSVAAHADSPAGRYVGVASCVSSGCHGATQPLRSTRILQNEYYTWLNSDQHSKAFNVLFNERSARIGRNMRLRGHAYEEALCLDCHSTNVAAPLIAGHVDPEDGVQCEACHGPASGWRAEHAQEGWTHAQSVARGMVDLRNVSRRASLCLSCHMGNASREVDHELIASGHPVLSFELDNYTETMPPHWTPNRDTHGLRAWSVGQVESFVESLSNLSRHARGDKWPEFSDMNCGNCHHSLKTSGWRQKRGWPGRAGLPAWSDAHWIVMRRIIERASPSTAAELDPLVDQLGGLVSHMTDRTRISETAERVRSATIGALAEVQSLRWSDDDVRQMIREIAGARDVADVAGAEQIALSLQTLSSALVRRNPALLKSDLVRAVDAVFEDLQSRDDYDPTRFAAKLQAVRAATGGP